MNLKKQKVIHTLMNLSLILYIVYLVSVLFICLVPKSVSIFASTARPDEFVTDWPQILGLLIAALLFFLSYFLCRNRIKTHSKSPLPVGILLILSAAILVFVLPAAVNLSRIFYLSPFFNSGSISEAVIVGWGAVSQGIHLLRILMYPALLLLFIAYSVYWIDAKTDSTNAIQ